MSSEPARPETYSHGHHASVLRSHSWRTAENSAAYLLPRLSPDDRLLDVGVGPGTITVDLAARLLRGEVVGIDNAASAVAATETLALEHGVTNLTARTGDVYHLDEEDGSFTVVHAHQVLQHLADPVAALREMRRVCARDGVVAVRDADYAAMTWYPDSPELTSWLALYQAVARANGGEPDAGRRLVSWAYAAGCTDVTATASVWCFASPEDRSWWSQTWAERLEHSAFGHRAVELGLADPAELSRLADGWLRWAEHRDAWFTVLHGEILAR